MRVPWRRHAPATVALSLLAGAAIAMVVAPDVAGTVGPLAFLVGYSTAAITILRKAQRLDGRDRVAWTIIGSGFLIGAVGILALAVTESVIGEVPAFGPLDLFFLANYVVVLAGFFYLPHMASSRVQRLRVYLDGMIGALSIATVMWVVALDDLVPSLAGSSAWERWAGTAYPILDVAALMMVVIVISRRSAFRFDPRLLLFGLGLLVQVFADLSFLRAGVGNSFADTDPNFLAFMIASAFYLAAATIVDRQPRAREHADRSASLWSMIAPYSAALILVGLLLVEIRHADVTATTRGALVVTLLVALLVAIRQGVAIREIRRVVEKQRSDLVSSISHELRTPLTAIVGFLDMMSDPHSGLTVNEREQLVVVALQQSLYLEHLVSDLVPLRSESPGDLALALEEIDIEAVIARALETLGPGEAEIHVEIEPGLRARVDSRRLQQVLVNLVTNASRYGGGRCLVTARAERDNLVIEVHDDGPGVPRKWELAIWKRFERGPNRFNAGQPGTGIGLAVVAAIAEAHGGRAGYHRSDRLGGACFDVVLPRRMPLASPRGAVEEVGAGTGGSA